MYRRTNKRYSILFYSIYRSYTRALLVSPLSLSLTISRVIGPIVQKNKKLAKLSFPYNFIKAYKDDFPCR